MNWRRSLDRMLSQADDVLGDDDEGNIPREVIEEKAAQEAAFEAWMEQEHNRVDSLVLGHLQKKRMAKQKRRL